MKDMHSMNIYILKIPKSIWHATGFCIRNFRAACKLSEFRSVSLGEKYEVVPCVTKLIHDVIRLSDVLEYAGKIDIVKKIFLKFCGRKLCFVLKDKETGESIGYSLFYFNQRDVDEKTVHEGYVGMMAEYHGRGVGIKFRKIILQHFARMTMLYGTSSRVSLSNKASLVSNLKNGYVIKEQYFDKYMNEERVYMVCDLNQYREKEEDYK